MEEKRHQISIQDEHSRISLARGNSGLLTLFWCGDVMTGRGIDQILPHPSRPDLHERYIEDARGYVDLAERANDPIPRSVDLPISVEMGTYADGDVVNLLRGHPMRLEALKVMF